MNLKEKKKISNIGHVDELTFIDVGTHWGDFCKFQLVKNHFKKFALAHNKKGLILLPKFYSIKIPLIPEYENYCLLKLRLLIEKKCK